MTNILHKTLVLFLCVALCLCLAPAVHAEAGGDGVLVQFLAEEDRLLACLSVTDENGAAQKPAADPDTGDVTGGCYLLLPGTYVYTFHDDAGLYEDLTEKFLVEGDASRQFLNLDPAPRYEVVTFSFTYINPIYEGVVTEADIPVPSVSEEQLAADTRELAEQLAESSGSTSAKFRRNSGVINQTVEAAGLELRAQIKEFEDEATITLAWESKPSTDTWRALASQVFASAIEHTGVPTEGDYLRYEYGGYSATGAIEQVGEQYVCRFVYALMHFTNAAQEAELEEVADGILTGLALAGKNEDQKALAIYQYLCDTVTGSGSDDLQFTAYGALVQKGAVCQGFSTAFYRLCLAAGIDTRIIQCVNMTHAWNIVKVGDRYYCVDATWDNGRSPQNYRYFLKGSNTWLNNHKWSGISELGDQYKTASFAAAYALPEYDYQPIVMKQPESAGDYAGRNVSFTVEAVGADLAYQWETRAGATGTWQTVSGASSAALTVPVRFADDGRSYRCKLTNGGGSLYSDAVTLTVHCTSLSLTENLDLCFYVSGGGSYDGLTLSWTQKDGTQKSQKLTDGAATGDGGYRIVLDSFAAREMTVPITVTLQDSDGNTVKTAACSVQNCCNEILDRSRSGDAAKALCRAALDYGTFAQLYFGYRTGDLANPAASAALLPAVPESFKAVRSGACTGVTATGVSAVLEDRTDLNLCFFLKDGYSENSYTLTVRDAAGNQVTPTCAALSSGDLSVTIPGIAPAALGDLYTVTLQNKADGTAAELSVSALSYAWAAQTGETDQANLGRALYQFYLAASAAQGGNNA